MSFVSLLLFLLPKFRYLRINKSEYFSLNNMLRPAYLQPGDKVALVSPAGAIHPQHIGDAEMLFRSWGLQPVTGKYAASLYDSFAGSDDERLRDFQWAIDDEEIKAIFCTTGGYGCLRIIENIDFSLFQGSPKWIVGSREITVFHSQLNLLGIESIYAPMPSDYRNLPPETLENLRNILFGELTYYRTTTNPLSRPGITQAEISGGCINTICRLHGTSIQHNFKGNILFLDATPSILEMEYIVRCMKLSKIFQHIQGIVITDTLPQFNKETIKLINEISADYNYPVCFGWALGIRPLILGAKIIFSISDTETNIHFA